jgi:hypothetical protein
MAKAKPAKRRKPTPKIVAAVGVSSSATAKGPNQKALSRHVEAAMQRAVTDAMAEGISVEDSVTMKARMMAARKAVLDAAR